MIDSYLRLAEDRIQLLDAIPLDFPLAIDFEITNKCNFNCKFCPIGAEEYEKEVGYDQVEPEVLETIVQQIKASEKQLKVFRFSMFGEALLHPKLQEMLRCVKQSNIAERIEITTNGSTLTKKKVSHILESPPDLIRISIYGLDEIEYSQNTGTTGMFRRVINGVQNLANRKKELALSEPHIYIKSFETDEERRRRFVHLFERYADELGYEEGHEWDGRVRMMAPAESEATVNRRRVCPLPFYKVVINSSGDLTFCCVDWKRSTSVGNIKNNTIHELFNGSKAIKFREALITGADLPDACSRCSFFKRPFFVKDNIDGLTIEDLKQRVNLKGRLP